MFTKVTKGQKKAAAELGRRGGRSRAQKMSPELRREIAQKAAKARWKKSKNQKPLKNKG
jgi:hypothetical protein